MRCGSEFFRACDKKLEGSMESVSGMGFCLGFISLPRIWVLVFKNDGLFGLFWSVLFRSSVNWSDSV